MFEQATIPETLAAVVRKLLRPLVKLCLGHGLKYQQVAELLKAAYVEAARDARDDKRVNVSQVAVATGVHRKDVNRLLKATPGRQSLPASLEAEVFTRWIADPDFCDAEGQPLALARQAPAPDLPSFEALTRRVTVDVHPRAVLDAMLRLGLVEERGDGLIRLCTSAFVPEPESQRMLAFLADNVHDHLAAAVSNALRSPGGLLEQSVYGDGFSADSVEQLHTLSRRHWHRVLRDIARVAQDLEARDRDRAQAEQRFRVGLYFYAEGSGSSPRATTANAPSNAGTAPATPAGAGRRGNTHSHGEGG